MGSLFNLLCHVVEQISAGAVCLRSKFGSGTCQASKSTANSPSNAEDRGQYYLAEDTDSTAEGNGGQNLLPGADSSNAVDQDHRIEGAANSNINTSSMNGPFEILALQSLPEILWKEYVPLSSGTMVLMFPNGFSGRFFFHAFLEEIPQQPNSQFDVQRTPLHSMSIELCEKDSTFERGPIKWESCSNTQVLVEMCEKTSKQKLRKVEEMLAERQKYGPYVFAFKHREYGNILVCRVRAYRTLKVMKIGYTYGASRGDHIFERSGFIQTRSKPKSYKKLEDAATTYNKNQDLRLEGLARGETFKDFDRVIKANWLSQVESKTKQNSRSVKSSTPLFQGQSLSFDSSSDSRKHPFSSNEDCEDQLHVKKARATNTSTAATTIAVSPTPAATACLADPIPVPSTTGTTHLSDKAEDTSVQLVSPDQDENGRVGLPESEIPPCPSRLNDSSSDSRKRPFSSNEDSEDQLHVKKARATNTSTAATTTAVSPTPAATACLADPIPVPSTTGTTHLSDKAEDTSVQLVSPDQDENDYCQSFQGFTSALGFSLDQDENDDCRNFTGSASLEAPVAQNSLDSSYGDGSVDELRQTLNRIIEEQYRSPQDLTSALLDFCLTSIELNSENCSFEV